MSERGNRIKKGAGMRRKSAVIVACFVGLLCLFAFAGCTEPLTEVGEWKLWFFGDGNKNYTVGDEYLGGEVTEDLYSCTFDGALYKVYKKGTLLKEGEYAAENSGENSVLLALNDGGTMLYWNLGTEKQHNGQETLRIIGEVDGKTICFIPV